LVWR
jgi:hypothetical protein